MSSTAGSERGRADRRRASPGRVRPRTSPSRAGPAPARPGSTARPPPPSRRRGRARPAHEARPAARRAMPASSRSHARTTPARVGEATSPTYAAFRASAAASASSSQMPWVATTMAGATLGLVALRGRSRRRPARRRETRPGRRSDRRPITRQPAAAPRAASAPAIGCRAGDPQDRRGQMRFHVDLQGAPRVAGHHQLDHAVAAPALGGGVLRQAQQPRLAVDEGAERLADDDRLGAAAADPALDRAVGMDDPRRARAVPTSAA